MARKLYETDLSNPDILEIIDNYTNNQLNIPIVDNDIEDNIPHEDINHDVINHDVNIEELNNVNLESYEEVSRLTEIIGNVKTGLSEEKLKRFPFFILKTHYKISREEKCHICIDTWEDNQRLTRLNCFHLFHTECISTWLKEKKKCPICNHEVIF